MAADTVNPDDVVKLAVGAVNRGEHADAETLCRYIVQHDPIGEAYYILGFIALQQGRHQEAIDNCSLAVTLGLGGWHNQLLLGAAYTALGQHSLAHQALLDAARQNPSNVETALRLLKLTLEHHSAAHAEALYRELFAALGVREIDDAWRAMHPQPGGPAPAPKGVRLIEQETALAWARRTGLEVLVAGEIEAIPIQAIGEDRPTSYVTGNTPYVVDLPDVQVFAYSHLVLAPDGMVLNEAGGHAQYGRFVDHHSDPAVAAQDGASVVMGVGAYEMQDLDEGIWLAGPASDAFGHWIGEFAPRLQFLEQHPAFAGRPIIVDEKMPPSHLELLGMLCSNPLVTLRRGQGLRVRRLLYAPTPTFFPIHLLPNDMPPFVACCASVRTYQFFKDRVEQALGVTPPTGGKYYLSRHNRSWRRIRNEDEVRGYLESRDYQTVMTEDLTFTEQVRLFQSAASIMAPTGSAMQNFIFAPKDVELFVLTQENLHNHAAFNGQARAMGYAPKFVCGQALGQSSQKHTDYIIPIEALAKALG